MDQERQIHIKLLHAHHSKGDGARRGQIHVHRGQRPRAARRAGHVPRRAVPAHRQRRVQDVRVRGGRQRRDQVRSLCEP